MTKPRKPILHLICGLPGSGKSTFAIELEKRHPALRLTVDEWIINLNSTLTDEKVRGAVEKLQWDVALKALALGIDVILEFGFWSRSERDTYRRQAHAIGAVTKLHYLNVPTEELKKRIADRNLKISTKSLYVDPKQIDGWVAGLEVPSIDELE